LAKIIKQSSPKLIEEDDISDLADTTFRSMLGISANSIISENANITCDVFRQYCTTNADTRLIFDLFDSACNEDSISDIEAEGTVLDRSELQTLIMDPIEAIKQDVDLTLNNSPGDEFLAVKPWEGTIVTPTNPPKCDTSAPELSLSLDWVYGYRSQVGLIT